jgi:hypothetical protein
MEAACHETIILKFTAARTANIMKRLLKIIVIIIIIINGFMAF